jgi:hypothetical protein
VARAGSGQHTISELTRLGPSSARWPGSHQGEGGFSPRVLDTAARRRGGVEEEDRGSACCRRSRAARSMASTSASPLCSSPAPWRPGEAANSSVKRKQGVRLGDVGPGGVATSGFRQRRPSWSGGVAVQPGGDMAVPRRGGLGSSTAAQQCSPPLLLLFFFSPWSFLFPPESAARAGAWRLRLAPQTGADAAVPRGGDLDPPVGGL